MQIIYYQLLKNALNKKKLLRDFGWCANFKIDTERINIDNLKFRTILTFINNFLARWVGRVVVKKHPAVVILVHGNIANPQEIFQREKELCGLFQNKEEEKIISP